MKIDLNEIPLIDNHCHPFPASRNPSYFERLVTLSLLPQKTESVRSTCISDVLQRSAWLFWTRHEHANGGIDRIS